MDTISRIQYLRGRRKHIESIIAVTSGTRMTALINEAIAVNEEIKKLTPNSKYRAYHPLKTIESDKHTQAYINEYFS